jgi:hypothetical protein
VIGEHTGVLGPMENGANADVDDMGSWSRSGYIDDPRCNNSLLPGPDRDGVCTNWTDWPTDVLQEYLLRIKRTAICRCIWVCFVTYLFLGADTCYARG